MKAKRAVHVAGVWLLLAAMPVFAHHGLDKQFDSNMPVTLKGTITKVVWRC